MEILTPKRRVADKVGISFLWMFVHRGHRLDDGLVALLAFAQIWSSWHGESRHTTQNKESDTL